MTVVIPDAYGTAMGSLSDAIKQHLELKREHGADAEQVERELEAALGPPRRDEGDAELSPDVQQHVAGAEQVEPPVPPVVKQPVAEAPAEAMPEPEPMPPATDQAPAAGDTIEFDFAAPAEPAEPEMDVYEPDAKVMDAAPPAGEPATELAAEPAPLADDVPPDPDLEEVLEDTPEFFEETPEYDRLWFEEKAPKDFDF